MFCDSALKNVQGILPRTLNLFGYILKTQNGKIGYSLLLVFF